MQFILEKMRSEQHTPIRYFLGKDNASICVNDWIGESISIRYLGQIYCLECGRKIKKSFMQGFCYPCFQTSPNASECIISPEKCRGHEGIGRDINWENDHHVQPHTVYFSYTSGFKVGVTRFNNEFTRWVDQGALAAVALYKVPYRQLAGQLEVGIKELVYDKTFWQRMLKMTDLPEGFEDGLQALIDQLPQTFDEYKVPNPSLQFLTFPIQHEFGKISSLNLDKTPLFTGKLMGIKGQYLVFDDSTVFNVRKFGGYEVEIVRV